MISEVTKLICTASESAWFIYYTDERIRVRMSRSGSAESSSSIVSRNLGDII